MWKKFCDIFPVLLVTFPSDSSSYVFLLVMFILARQLLARYDSNIFKMNREIKFLLLN